MRSGALVLVCLLAAGCGTLGSDGGEPGDLPHNGVGQFRTLTSSETGVRGGPPGRVVPLPRNAFDSGMVCADRLFHINAALIPDAGPQPDGFPEGEVDWSLFEPRRIHRSPPVSGIGFGPGEPILEAASAWEGADLLDPWAIVLGDGRARLYYAAAGGIGVAEAPTIDGAFTRVGDGPITLVDGGETPRRPSVVPSVDGRDLWMFYESAGDIWLASSADGLAFDPVDGDPGTAELDALDLGAGAPEAPAQVAVGAPGAMRVESPVGRPFVRVYFESRRSDGSRTIALAATEDGVRYDRLPRAVLEEEDRRMPAPLAIDARVTLLYQSAPFLSGDRQLRGIVASVAPRTVFFAAE